MELNIVILNSSAYFENSSLTPEYLDVLNSYKLLLNSDYFLKLFLVDNEFNYVLLGSSFHSNQIKDEYSNLLKLDTLYDINNESIVTVVPSFYHTSNLTFIGKTIYVSCLDTKSSYDIMLYIENLEVKDKFFYSHTSENKIILTDICELFLNKKLTETYDLLSAKKIPSKINKNDLLFLKKNFLVGIDLIIGYMSCNYHILSPEFSLPEKRLPNWMYNIETPILKSIILYFGIKSPFYDKPLSLMMIEYSELRHTLTMYLISFLSNFIINNNIIKKELIKDKGWLNIETWILIKKLFKL